MKRIRAIALFAVAALTTVSGAMAQWRTVRATIPFDFTVENKSLPAGTYEITPSLGNVIRIQNTSDPRIMASVGTLRDSTEIDAELYNESVLIFEKYGDRYFLHEVHGPTILNVSLFRSKEEKQVRQQAAMLKLNDADQILIAAK
jgi:hypothetical protein